MDNEYDEDGNTVNKLLTDLSDNRFELKGMLVDVKKFRTNIDKLLPEKMDFKNKWLMPERMKILTEVIRNELSIRQQIDSSLKIEIDIRRKTKDEDESDFDNLIKAAAKAMENDKKSKEGGE